MTTPGLEHAARERILMATKALWEAMAQEAIRDGGVNETLLVVVDTRDPAWTSFSEPLVAQAGGERVRRQIEARGQDAVICAAGSADLLGPLAAAYPSISPATRLKDVLRIAVLAAGGVSVFTIQPRGTPPAIQPPGARRWTQ